MTQIKKQSKHIADLVVMLLKTPSPCQIFFQLIKDLPVRRDMFSQPLSREKKPLKCVTSASNLAMIDGNAFCGLIDSLLLVLQA